jgi:hypothetical protein
VPGNQDGSYLTMKSNQGLVFGAATILSGFSGVFCDQGYWQRVRTGLFTCGVSVGVWLIGLWLGFVGDCEPSEVDDEGICKSIFYMHCVRKFLTFYSADARRTFLVNLSRIVHLA